MRENGTAIVDPLIWFGADKDNLYIMTRSDSEVFKRIRNNPRVRVAPCTMRGKIVGPGFAAEAPVLRRWPRARKAIERKYR